MELYLYTFDMVDSMRAAAGSSSTSRPTSERASSRTTRPISKIATTFLLIFIALLLVGALADAADTLQITFRNELPKEVLVYWEGADRIPQGDPIPAKGGEREITTFPGHKFTYDFDVSVGI